MFVAWTRVVALKVVDSNWSGNGLWFQNGTNSILWLTEYGIWEKVGKYDSKVLD